MNEAKDQKQIPSPTNQEEKGKSQVYKCERKEDFDFCPIAHDTIIQKQQCSSELIASSTRTK